MVLLTDGGGVVRAALAPIVGAADVAAVLSRITASPTPAQVNGNPALILRQRDGIDGVVAIRVAGGRITGLYAVRNPEKLARVERETTLTPRVTA